jgi:transposase
LRAVIEAMQAWRGVAQTTAATIGSELGSLTRFANPSQLMGYSGLVASWPYHRPHVTGFLLRRQKNLHAAFGSAVRICHRKDQCLPTWWAGGTGNSRIRTVSTRRGY